MSQDQYLQRLRNIREKYTVSKVVGLDSNPDLKNLNPQQISKINLDTPSRYMPINLDQQPFQYSRIDRSFSQKQIRTSGKSQSKDTPFKRLENFNTFIKDLDKKIQEKQKVLLSRYQTSQTQQNQENIPFQIARNLSRYNSSSKVIHKPITEQYVGASQEKYLNKRQQIKNNHNFDSIYKLKICPDKRGNEKLKIINEQRPKIRDIGGFNYDNAVGCELWSVSKLENIQQRIKAVLQKNNY